MAGAHDAVTANGGRGCDCGGFMPNGGAGFLAKDMLSMSRQPNEATGMDRAEGEDCRSANGAGDGCESVYLRRW